MIKKKASLGRDAFISNYLSWAGVDSHAEMLRPNEMSNHQKKNYRCEGGTSNKEQKVAADH
jgi:hypothetical protein